MKELNENLMGDLELGGQIKSVLGMLNKNSHEVSIRPEQNSGIKKVTK